MKITITLNGVKVEKNIPQTWKEVTFGQFVKLSKAKNDLAEIISVFTDIEPDIIRKAQIGNIVLIEHALSFIQSDKIDFTPPETLIGIKVPKNPEELPIARYEDFKIEAKEMETVGIEKYAVMCAIYLVDPYDHSKAEELSKEVLNAPCEEVMATGVFISMRLKGLKTHGLNDILNPNSLMRKLKLAMTGWLARLVFTVRFYLWKRKLRSIARNY